MHEPVGERYRRLVLASDTIAATAQAGQFLMITVPPHDGDTIPCTVFLVDGRQLAVVLTITSDRGAYIADIPR